ncbi:MAG: glycosyltransferase family 4 protein [Proteobacteria bacterium]|nr:glycosyltransferase family 4 protein [Pseudomonadota bacterium]
MARVAFFLDTRRIRSADLRDVDAGNPGVGGTEYMFFLVAAHLARRHQVSMYVTAAGHHPPGIRYAVVRDIREAAVAIRAAGEEIVILRESEVLPNQALLGSMKQSVVVWAHNFSSRKTLRICARLPGVARYLCVSREQHKGLRNEAVFRKADHIFNAVVASTCPTELQPPTQDNVVYMGSLVKGKGFHVLARYWGDIARAVPTARLHVVGSRRLYNEGAALGPLGLASPRYERRFAKYVTEHGRLRKDIVFHGVLGADKWRLLREAKVAVTNPTGAGETFCIGAAEFGLLGVPVVTRNVGGPIDVVENGVSGILFDDESELPDAVTSLLRDENRRAEMGRNAMARVRSRFDIEVVIEKWHKVIDEILASDPVAADL